MKEILLLQLAYYHVFWAAQLLVTQAWVKSLKNKCRNYVHRTPQKHLPYTFMYLIRSAQI